MKTSIYGKMQMNISTNKILQSSLKLSHRKVIDSLLCHFRNCTKPFIHYINHYMIIQYFATAALKPSFAVKHLLFHIYIFVCNTIHSTCVARSACLENKTGKHKQLTIPIAEGRCISFFFFEPVQQVPPLQHRREELDQIFVVF